LARRRATEPSNDGDPVLADERLAIRLSALFRLHGFKQVPENITTDLFPLKKSSLAMSSS
jgi:hypothetical protein